MSALPEQMHDCYLDASREDRPDKSLRKKTKTKKQLDLSCLAAEKCERLA